MKKLISNCLNLLVIVVSVSLTSCATICGGAKYNAEIIVDNHPKAEINYNGQYIGSGRAFIKIPRRNANKITFAVKEEGKKEQYYNFQKRVFRGWSLLGTIIVWTGYIEGIYLPWGVALDGITGSWWKPDDNENGIVKVDYDNYRYFLKYKAENEETVKSAYSTTQPSATEPEASIETKLEQINSLKEKGLISDEEYDKMRENILNNF